jgi:hypothetical protein
MRDMKIYLGMHGVTFFLLALVLLAYGVRPPHLYFALGGYFLIALLLFLGRWSVGEFKD